MDHGLKCKTIKCLGQKHRREAMESRARQRVVRHKEKAQFVKRKI